MKTDKQLAGDLLAKRDAYFARRRRVTAVTATVCVCLALFAGIGAWTMTRPAVTPEGQSPAEQKRLVTEFEETVGGNGGSSACYAAPQAGECLIVREIYSAMEHYGHSEDVEYLVVMNIDKPEGRALTDDDVNNSFLSAEELAEEYARLQSLGYRLCTVTEDGYDGESYKFDALRCTESELLNFPASERYAYTFFFATNVAEVEYQTDYTVTDFETNMR